MFENKKNLHGIQKILTSIPFVDTSPDSQRFFNVIDLPEKFYAGKNFFKVLGNKRTLVPKSKIAIDIVDSEGKPVYYEILKYRDSDGSRIVVVYIYPSVAVGELTIFMAGRTFVHPKTGEYIPYSYTNEVSDTYYLVPNIVWIRRIPVDKSKIVSTNPFFIQEPLVEFSEKFATFSKLASGSRFVTVTNEDTSATFSLLAKQSTKKSIRDVSKEIDARRKRIKTIPTVEGGSVRSTRSEAIDSPESLILLYSDSGVFDKSMVGGHIVLHDIDISQEVVALGGVPPSPFSVSGSIVRVISNKTVQANLNYYYEVNGVPVERIQQIPSWSITYVSDNSDLISQKSSASLVDISLYGLEPNYGSIQYVEIFYKQVESVGDYKYLGKFDVKSQNILVDPDKFEMRTEDGLINKSMGNFKDLSTFNEYWTYEFKGFDGDFAIETGKGILNGVDLVFENQGIEKFIDVHLKNDYEINLYADTEYVLEFDSEFIYYDTNSDLDFFDVHISGSAYVESTNIDLVDKFEYIENEREYGEFIGRVDARSGKRQHKKFYFYCKKSGTCVPRFILRSGAISLADIKLRVRHEHGFTANVMNYRLPLELLVKDSELIFKFRFLSADNQTSNVETVAYGLIFSGSTVFQEQVSNTIRITEVSSGSIDTEVFTLQSGSILLMSSDGSIASSWGGATSVAPRVGSYEYVFDGFLGTWSDSGLDATINFPIINKLSPFAELYNAANDRAAGMYELSILFYGISGPKTDPTNNYSWGVRISGRFLIYYKGSNGIIYTATPANVFYFGDYGGADENYEDALLVMTNHNFSIYSGNLVTPFIFAPDVLPSGETMDIYYGGSCRVWKIEYEK